MDAISCLVWGRMKVQHHGGNIAVSDMVHLGWCYKSDKLLIEKYILFRTFIGNKLVTYIYTNTETKKWV